MRALDCNKAFDCYPILWVWHDKSRVVWSIKLLQKVAMKFMVVKLIDIHRPGEIDESLNFDMFNLKVEGFKLQIPS